MKTFYLWYDNGTGFYEGPYPVEANSLDEAIEKENLRWCINMYGIGAVVNSESNPNIPERKYTWSIDLQCWYGDSPSGYSPMQAPGKDLKLVDQYLPETVADMGTEIYIKENR